LLACHFLFMGFGKIKIILIIIAVVIISGIIYVTTREEKVEYITAKIERGDLVQTVSEVGIVKASQEIELNFLQSGRVAKTLVKIGDGVAKNQVLAELDYSSLTIQEQEAQANLDIAKAKLNKLLMGATRQEIAVSQASVTQARAAYDSAQKELAKAQSTVADNITQAQKTLADLESGSADNITPYEQAVITAQINLNNTKSTYQQSADNKKETLLTTIDNKLAVANTALDNINTILNDNDASPVLSKKNPSYLNNTNNSYNAAVDLLDEAEISLGLAQISQSDGNISQAEDDFSACLDKVFAALNCCYNALESTIVSSSFTQVELNTYKTNISAQITAVSTGITSVETADQNWQDAKLTYSTKVAEAEDALADAQVDLDNAINNARNSLSSVQLSSDQQITTAQAKVDANREAWEVAKAKLNELKSPPRIEDVSLSQAQVKQAEASLNLIRKQIEDSIIKAPIEGTIIKIEYETGEQVVATKPAISMLSENNFEVEVDVSEADITKVKVNNPTEITLDAFGDDIKFYGNVYFIEPAETIIQDVIYYKIKINFNTTKSDVSNVKSGMTANVIITTAQRNGVLIVPSRAIVQKNSDKYIRVLMDGEISEIPIGLGLRGDEGMVEVLSGVKEGDEVVTYIKENK